ncbi:hypothetical protein M976_00589 [Buttiauxella ferragutiae ATCC 51602]|uniref:Uncharacterized protein n=1 Tax=Buttiauxella ferragutiae ATCC 51602 TaxID=1354252 RepID=A0ABX2WCY5_9ENTR|nr:hypothetical protein [Buttiauxella ferragutiae]OAT31652.1 hypothetical protein M976_00589 [Buttiauxella ferragutiae ATCC 51602]
MNHSDYLRVHMEAERKIALSLEKGIKLFQENSKEVMSSIYSGVERATWYSACFFDEYQDVCQELREEDKRMIAAINEVFKRNDVILDMIELYVKYVLDNFNENSRTNIITQITGYLAKNRVRFVTKSTISYVIAKSISESIGFTAKIRTAIAKLSNVTLTLLGFYSYVQKAALSARRLKLLNPPFYQILHHENIEMLYFIIEPVLQKNIGYLNTTLSERDAITILRDIVK